MVRSSELLGAAAAALALAAAAPAWPQVSASPVKDLTPHGFRKPPPVPANLAPPNTDPRDLNGVYASQGGGPRGGFGLPGGGPPRGPGPQGGPGLAGGPGPAGGAQPAGPPRLPPRSNDPFTQCMPELSVGSAGNPGMIVQTPGRLTFIGEGNNDVRRIYLDEPFPATIVPTRLGYSIGHWDGDTLVVETRGLKTNAADSGMASITRIVERLHKSADGRSIDSVSTIDGVGKDGKPTTVTAHGRMTWRPDEVPIEVVCEQVQEFKFP